MKLKRIFAGALALCLCASLWVGTVPAQAAGTLAPAFLDIPDSAQAESAELLRLLGVISGDGAGHFSPNDQLTRAEFCAMAIGVRKETAQAEAMMNYTFFKDVRGDHWARGFINYASRITVGDSGERLVSGVGDANFAPDRPIEFAEAVTMVVRLLGYSQKDISTGATWYSGYMAVGRAAGLLEGLDLAPEAYLTRGQAAVLFRNLLFADLKDGDSSFFAGLGGTEVKNVVLLSTNATAPDGTTGCIEVTTESGTEPYKTDHAAFSASLQGAKVDLMLDENQKVVAVRTVDTVTRRAVTLSAHEATYITTAAGEKISIPGDTDFYRGNVKSKYSDVYMNLKAGGQLSLVYDRTGKLEYAFLSTGADTTYDIATRLTAIYEDASPSPRTPLTVRVLGTNLTVLESAVEELSAFKPGDRVTLLLTADGKVAGAAKPDNNARSTLVGIVTEGSADSANVKPILGLKDSTGADVTFSGKVNTSAEKLVGELVILSSSRADTLALTRVGESGAKGTLNVQNRTLGGEALADRVYLYERTAGGKPEPIDWNQITVATVPASKISYAGTDESGKVNVLVLNDVTGDGYAYGYLSPRTETVTVPASGGLPESSYNEYYIDLTCGGKTEFRVRSNTGLRSSTPGGIAKDVNGWGSYITLTEIKRVPRSSFNTETMTVTISGVTYPIAENVECYNRTTGLWFGTGAEGLAAARAYGESLSVYYDKSPSEGGKIRMVVVG